MVIAVGLRGLDAACERVDEVRELGDRFKCSVLTPSRRHRPGESPSEAVRSGELDGHAVAPRSRRLQPDSCASLPPWGA